MPERFKQRIIKHVSHDAYEAATAEQMAIDLGVPEEDGDDFLQAITELERDQRVLIGAGDRVALPGLPDEITGTFRKHAKGFGFLIPQGKYSHGDLFVPPDNTLDAMSGDIVRAKVLREKRRGKNDFVGDIVEVLERKHTSFSGELVKRGAEWIVMPDGKAATQPVVVRDPGAKNAKAGDKVIFEIIEHAEGDYLAEGVITKVLGEAGEPDVETQAIIEAHNLPGDFPESCIQQTRDVTQAFEEEIERAIDSGKGFPDREDLRNEFIATIDPPDARDFDDAISLTRTESGGWRLGVHIADVSSFIKLGSPLDVEAAERGNSVYLPRLVIPMLPELLSNGICSLQEGVPRFCKSAYMEYDKRGNVTKRGFASTVIHSAKRMTYLEAQALIDGDIKEARKHARTEPKYSEQLIDTVREMNSLATAIRKRRRRAGMIHLDLPEVELIFNDEGRVIDAEPEDDAFTHTIIEMFMVEANESLAKLFESVGVPLLRRVHPEPTPGEFGELQKFVSVAGYRIPKSPSREELQGLLDATRGTAAGPAVHMAVLRTLTKAEYSPAHIGHFALASDAYAHFTSPIRRYPDLTVHRALGEYLKQTNNGKNPPHSDKEKKALGKKLNQTPACPDDEALRQIGSQCGRTEDRAEAAERELRNFLVMQLMSEHIGAEFPGVITGVTNSGVFVRLDKYLVEGLVRTQDLPTPEKWGGRWRLDQRTGALVHEGSGRSFKLGDRVAVIVAEVDLARRQMELLISDESAKKREGVGKALKLGGAGGGIGSAEGAGFDASRTGSQKRSQRSRSRDKRKKDYRQDRKNKRKGQ